MSVRILIFVILLILSTCDVIHPRFVLQVPLDGLLDPFFELERWLPTEFALELGAVDGVSCVMTKAVGNVCDEVEVCSFWSAEESIYCVDDGLDDVNVLPLVEDSDVVGFGYGAVVEDGVDGACMIYYIKPVAYVLALAIDRERLAMADTQ